ECSLVEYTRTGIATRPNTMLAVSIARAAPVVGCLAMTWHAASRVPARRMQRTSSMSHEAKVERIARELRAYRGTAPLSLRKRAVPHQVPKRLDRKRHDRKLDLTDLDDILDIDPDRRTCTAEPGVTFCDLVEATLQHGLVPLVVPELATITIGGAV